MNISKVGMLKIVNTIFLFAYLIISPLLQSWKTLRITKLKKIEGQNIQALSDSISNIDRAMVM